MNENLGPVGKLEWHPAVRKTRSAYEGQKMKYGRYVMPKREMPDLALKVTEATLDRALGFLNRLAWALGSGGFAFEMPAKDKTAIKLIYTDLKIDVSFNLREELQRVARPKEHSWQSWDYKGTGKLRLTIDEYWPSDVRKSWGESKNTKLEEKIDDIAQGFVAFAKGKHEHSLEMKAREARWENEAKIREAAEARRAEEEARRDKLFEHVDQWSKAQRLRDFRAAAEATFRAKNSGDPTPSQSQWLAWVDQIVLSTDPLCLDAVRYQPD